VRDDDPQEDAENTSGYGSRLKRFFSHFAVIFAAGEHAADLIRTLGKVGRNEGTKKQGQKPSNGEKDTAVPTEATRIKRTVSAAIVEGKPAVLRIDTPEVRTVVTVQPPTSSASGEKQQSGKETETETNKNTDGQSDKGTSKEVPKDAAKDAGKDPKNSSGEQPGPLSPTRVGSLCLPRCCWP
jgi:hypothetical protein